jgi:hypothetical protein
MTEEQFLGAGVLDLKPSGAKARGLVRLGIVLDDLAGRAI